MVSERISVKIPSATPEWNLDAWKYMPVKRDALLSGPCPVIVLAHGLSANKLLKLDEYAMRFAAEGYASLVFDYRRWGASDGKPRHVLKVAEQLADYRTVINWARRQPEFDEKRVVVWGTSFSGGHIMQIASEDPDIFAAIGQCPYAGSHRGNIRKLNLLRLVLLSITDIIKQRVGGSPVYLTATSGPGGGGILSGPGALEGLKSLVKDPSEMPNEINASCIFEIRPYKPHLLASTIKCPLLLIVPEADSICSMAGALDAGKNAEKAEIVRTEGDHFDVYPGRIGFDKSIKAQLNFLHKHVPV